jgi:hypothetical protein
LKGPTDWRSSPGNDNTKIELYEKEWNKRYTDEELYHAKSHIPFLLAALMGHHDGLSIAETELCAVHRGIGERTFSPSVYQMLRRCGACSWIPVAAFLTYGRYIHNMLPLLLVKTKLVADLRYSHQQFMAFK